MFKTTKPMYLAIMTLTTILLGACGVKPGANPAKSHGKSLCGGESNFQYVEQYDGTMGVTKSYVAQHQAAVGMVWDNSKEGYCTGTLISNDLFLTAGHCIGADIFDSAVAFNYLHGKEAETDVYKVEEVLESIEEETMDFAVVRLERQPGLSYPPTGLDPSTTLQKGENLVIIQHPEGQTKQIEAGPYAGDEGHFMTYEDLDTLGGSSGSGVLNRAGKIVGVHTNAGCQSSGGANLGVKLSAIFEVSQILPDLWQR